ncbi:RidA family protein [Pseudovibrio denitrificans]|uniref:RidA family protein n=1 Tax=Pseudovibrio denitrificans TaxID=258256 RepID=UPI0039BFD04C
MSTISPILPSDHTKPIGKYSPAIAVPYNSHSNLVFISGQVASDSSGHTIGLGDAGTQTAYVFDKIANILENTGGDLSHLVSLTIYLTSMADFSLVSNVRNNVLHDPAPSSTLVEVSRLAIQDHLVEISAVAVVPAK